MPHARRTGTVPDKARTGLTPTMITRGLFLACQCFPTHDLDVALADDVIDRLEARVCAIERLNDEIHEVHLRPSRPFAYRSGQFCVCSWIPNSRTTRLPASPRWTLICSCMCADFRWTGERMDFRASEAGDIVTISERSATAFTSRQARSKHPLARHRVWIGAAVRDCARCAEQHAPWGNPLVPRQPRRERPVPDGPTAPDRGHPSKLSLPTVRLRGPSADGHWTGTPLDLALADSPI